LQTLAQVEECSALVISVFEHPTADKAPGQHVTVSPKIFLTQAALPTVSNYLKTPADFTDFSISNDYLISSLPH